MKPTRIFEIAMMFISIIIFITGTYEGVFNHNYPYACFLILMSGGSRVASKF